MKVLRENSAGSRFDCNCTERMSKLRSYPLQTYDVRLLKVPFDKADRVILWCHLQNILEKFISTFLSL